MSTALDVLDILDIDDPGPKKSIFDKETLLARRDKKKSKSQASQPKRPENVPREVWGLHSTLNNELPPLMPTDDSIKYRQPKAVIGVGRVRRWHWTPFTNPARQDGLVLYHWRRERPEGEPEEEYPFARYNKHATIPEYTPEEYESLLQYPKWNEEKTAHLMELARRFDLRFIHMRDRWDSERFPGRPSVEDLKERYYGIVAILDKVRGTNLSKGLRYDAAHERRRKQQLSLLYGRTKDQVEEEQRLVQELRKIEARRRERERKKQDLQKLISQADSLIRDQDGGTDRPVGTVDSSLEALFPPATQTPGSASTASSAAGAQRKRATLPVSVPTNLYSVGAPDSSVSLAGSLGGTGDLSASLGAATSTANSALANTYVINFPDPSKNPGVHLRSLRMKLPTNLGQKKIRIIENFLAHLQIDPNPPATAELVEAYNNLRSKILLLYDLRTAHLHCDYELQSARLRLETFAPDKPLPAELVNLTLSAPGTSKPTPSIQSDGESTSLPGSQLDPVILAALRDCDSKRPIVPRHSLGVAGALAAAAGSSGLCNLPPPPAPHTSSSGMKQHATRMSTSVGSSPRLSHVSDHSGRSPSVQSGTSASSDSVTRTSVKMSHSHSDSTSSTGLRRKQRAAALEQGRVMKKLKIKGQLVD
ncbi:hypothetical protein CRM22_002479 [Opisthorchis felineus]|uniref:DNA methyltransferase 1-associated protein 1 n=1 Tax=Opisthorchis felineus TaxID=147828 RepID=A0A4S2M5X8_OPIFE|nr:hypothetical protein CRM22_002479 [Opisthorchis felineus]